LPFTLLSDENKEIVKKYGVWGKKLLWADLIWEQKEHRF
jgi:peroxiredoxin